MKRLMFTGCLMAVMGGAAWLAGCASKHQEAAPLPGATVTPSKQAADQGAVVVTVKPGGRVVLPAPGKSRNWKEVRLQAARRLVAANPDIIYMGKPPDLLRAIPVLTFELNANGTIRRVEVMRYPSQDRETVNIAIESMRRAAPFGNVAHLPKPWRFNETFLFNNQHKFKPMTLDQL